MQSYAVKQATTAQPLLFLMIDSSDHVSPKTGLSPTVTLSKNGGSFASPSGAVSEIGSGWYKVAGNATDNATLGPLALHATSAGADPTDVVFPVVAFDPLVATNLGLSALPTASPAASGGLPTTDASNGVKLSVGTGTGQVNLGSGKVPATVGSTDYAGNTPQTGDAFARIGATGSGLTSLAPAATALSTANWTTARAAGLDNLDAAITTRSTYAGGDTSGTTSLLSRLSSARAGYLDNLSAGAVALHADATAILAAIGTPIQAGSVTVGGYASGQDPATLVLDADIADHEASGSVGAAIAAAGGSGDPWATALPGSYTSGQAGYLVGHNLDAAVSTRSTFAGGAVAGVTAAVSIDLAGTLAAARDVDAIDDTALTLNDAFHCAIAGAAGKQSVSGTTYLVRTPSTGTTLRTFTLDSAAAPTSRT